MTNPVANATNVVALATKIFMLMAKFSLDFTQTSYPDGKYDEFFSPNLEPSDGNGKLKRFLQGYEEQCGNDRVEQCIPLGGQPQSDTCRCCAASDRHLSLVRGLAPPYTHPGLCPKLLQLYELDCNDTQ